MDQGNESSGIPVVADMEHAAAYICQRWVDEVLINVSGKNEYPQKLIDELLEMGMVVHLNLSRIKPVTGQKQFVEMIGGYTVLTTTMNYATDRQALAKRIMDIAGGLVGCLLTGIIFVFVGPVIYVNSPGPVFFFADQDWKEWKAIQDVQISKYVYGCGETEAELMAQNKMSDGRMFKLDFDPRVIGNKVMADGTKKTGIGEFIRKTSLDEFPQFWNVLKGDSGIIGTTKKNLDFTRVSLA